MLSSATVVSSPEVSTIDSSSLSSLCFFFFFFFFSDEVVSASEVAVALVVDFVDSTSPPLNFL